MNEKDQLQFVMSNIHNFSRIKNPNEEVLIYIIKKGYIKLYDWKNHDLSLNIQLALINNSIYNFFLIANPKESIILEVLSKNGMIIKEIKNQTEKMHEIALINNKLSFRHFTNPSENIVKKAVKNWTENLKFVKNPSIKLLEYCLKSDWTCFQYLEAIPYMIQKKIIQLYDKKSEKAKTIIMSQKYEEQFCNNINNINNCSGIFLVDLYSRLKFESLKKHKNWKSSASLILMKVKLNKSKQ